METIATAAAKIKSGMAECIIAGGAEVMSGMPFGGWKVVPNPRIAKEHPDRYWGMGLTAEAVAKEFKVSREDQDAFAYQSHQKALHAIENGHLRDGLLPINVEQRYLSNNNKIENRTWTMCRGCRSKRGLTPLSETCILSHMRGSMCETWKCQRTRKVWHNVPAHVEVR